MSTSKPPSNASEWHREILSVTAVAGRTQQVSNDKPSMKNTSPPILPEVLVASHLLAMAIPRRDFRTRQETGQRTSKNSVSIVEARDTTLSVAKTQSILSFFRSESFPNGLSACDWSKVKILLCPPNASSFWKVSALFGTNRHAFLKRSFERVCRISQTPGALQCSYAPRSIRENSKLACWVGTQTQRFKLQQEGTLGTLSRIQEVESLGFEWKAPKSVSYGFAFAWKDRLSGELADHHTIHGHCSVPKRYSGNVKLADRVEKQRTNYRLLQQGKTSPMTAFRIQELES
jgi:hypothetical protein